MVDMALSALRTAKAVDLRKLASGRVTARLMRPCAGSSIIYDFNLRVKRFIKRQRVS